MSDVLSSINSLQKDCLINRYLYYVKDNPILSDFEYDMREKELKRLREEFPEIWEVSKYRDHCPTETIGSSLPESYPEDIVWYAEERVTERKDLMKWMREDGWIEE